MRIATLMGASTPGNSILEALIKYRVGVFGQQPNNTLGDVYVTTVVDMVQTVTNTGAVVDSDNTTTSDVGGIAAAEQGLLFEFLNYVTPGLELLAAAVGVIVITYKIISAWISKDAIDPKMFIRPILTIIGIRYYEDLLSLLVHYPVIFIQDIMLDSVVIEQSTYTNVTTDITGGLTTTETFTKSYSGGAAKFLTVVNNMETVFSDIEQNNMSDTFATSYTIIYALAVIDAFLSFCAKCCIGYMLLKQLAQNAIMFCMGFLALILSVVPGNETVLKKWLYSYVMILLWVPCLIVMCKVMVGIDVVNGAQTQSMVAGMFLIPIKALLIFCIFKVSDFATAMVDAGVAIKPIETSGVGKQIRERIKTMAKMMTGNIGGAMMDIMKKAMGIGKKGGKK